MFNSGFLLILSIKAILSWNLFWLSKNNFNTKIEDLVLYHANCFLSFLKILEISKPISRISKPTLGHVCTHLVAFFIMVKFDSFFTNWWHLNLSSTITWKFVVKRDLTLPHKGRTIRYSGGAWKFGSWKFGSGKFGFFYSSAGWSGYFSPPLAAKVANIF